MLKYHHSFLVLLGALVFVHPASAMQKDSPQELKQRIARKGAPPIPPRSYPVARGRGVQASHKAHPPVPGYGREKFRGRGRRGASANDRFSRRLQRAQKVYALKHELPESLDSTSILAIINARHNGSSTEVVELPSGVKVSAKCVLPQLQCVQKALATLPSTDTISAEKGEIIAHNYAGKTATSQKNAAKGTLVVYKLLANGMPVTYTYEDSIGNKKEKQATLTLSVTIKE